MWKKKITAVALSVALVCGGTGVYANDSASSGKDEAIRQQLGSVATFVAEGLETPNSAVLLNDGSVFVSDTSNHTIYRIEDGEAALWAGASLSYKSEASGLPAGGWLDGEGELAFFNRPAGLAVGPDDSVYVADAGNHAIRQIDAEGKVTTIAGAGHQGHQDGAASEALFNNPSDVAVSADGIVYVADTLNHVIRRISADGEVSTIGVPSPRAAEWHPGVAVAAGGYKNGAFRLAEFNEPIGLALDDKGNLYVSDSGNNAIRYIDFAKKTVSTAAGLKLPSGGYPDNGLYAAIGFKDGSADKAEFNRPGGLSWSNEAGLLIADSGNHAVRALKDGSVKTIAGSLYGEGGSADGLESEALLLSPSDVVLLPGGQLIIADSGNGKLREWSGYEPPAEESADASLTAGAIRIDYNGNWLKGLDKLQIKQGRSLLPLGVFGEQLGFAVSIEEDSAVLTGKDGYSLALSAGSPVLTDGTQEWTMDIAPFAEGGELFVPVRSLAAAAGKDVQWIGAGKWIVIRDLAEGSAVPASAAVSLDRELLIESITGLASVTQGGLLESDAYAGMSLRQGDVLQVNEHSTVVLKAPDTGDRIAVNANARLDIAGLYLLGEARITKLALVAGTAYFDIHDMKDSVDRFEVLAGNDVLSVRGTHFTVGINPISSQAILTVLAGQVNAQPSGAPSSAPIFPAQQFQTGSGDEVDPLSLIVDYANLEDLISQMSPEIIRAILANKAIIDAENEAFLEALRSQANGEGQANGDLGSLEDLQRVQNNLNALLENLVKNAKERSTAADQAEIDRIIEEMNKAISDSQKKLDISQAPPIVPANGKDQEEKLKQLQQQQEKLKKEQEQKEQQLQNKAAQLLQELEKKKKEQEEANKKAKEKAKEEAEKKLREQLAQQELERFNKAQEQARQELEQRQSQVSPPPPPPVFIPNPNPNPQPEPEPNPAPSVTIELTTDRDTVEIGSNFPITVAGISNDTDISEDTIILLDIFVRQSDNQSFEEMELFREGGGPFGYFEFIDNQSGSNHHYRFVKNDGEDLSLGELIELLPGAVIYVNLVDVGQYEVTFKVSQATEQGTELLGEASINVNVDLEIPEDSW